MPSTKGPRSCRKNPPRACNNRNVARWLRSNRPRPFPRCNQTLQHLNFISVVGDLLRASGSANDSDESDSDDYITVIMDSGSENMENESEYMSFAIENLDNESESDYYDVDRSNVDSEIFRIESENHDIESQDNEDAIEISSVSSVSTRSIFGGNRPPPQQHNEDASEMSDNGNDNAASVSTISNYGADWPQLQHWDPYVDDFFFNHEMGAELQNEVELNDDPIQHVLIDINRIPVIPKTKRWREWMQTPTPGNTLTLADIGIQEGELVRHYRNSLPIESADIVEDENQFNGNICTICMVNRATRAIAPCGHYVCADCMTHMVTHRESFHGARKPKCCGVCMMAIGLFLRVYDSS